MIAALDIDGELVKKFEPSTFTIDGEERAKQEVVIRVQGGDELLLCAYSSRVMDAIDDIDVGTRVLAKAELKSRRYTRKADKSPGWWLSVTLKSVRPCDDEDDGGAEDPYDDSSHELPRAGSIGWFGGFAHGSRTSEDNPLANDFENLPF